MSGNDQRCKFNIKDSLYILFVFKAYYISPITKEIVNNYAG